MKFLIVLAFLLGMTYAQSTVTIQRDKFCQCTQLVLQADCLLYGEKCVWSGNACTENACTNILVQEACASTTRCMWIQATGSCMNFTSCSDLFAGSGKGCLALSNQCQKSANNVCQTNSQITCTSFLFSDDCTWGSDGKCLWTYNKCVQWSACDQAITSTECYSDPLACFWNSYSYACQVALCTDFTSQQTCQFAQQSPGSQTFQVCTWNTNGICTNGTMSSIPASECLSHTLGYFAWSSNDATSGSCNQCAHVYGYLLSIILLIALLAL